MIKIQKLDKTLEEIRLIIPDQNKLMQTLPNYEERTETANLGARHPTRYNNSHTFTEDQPLECY